MRRGKEAAGRRTGGLSFHAASGSSQLSFSHRNGCACSLVLAVRARGGYVRSNGMANERDDDQLGQDENIGGKEQGQQPTGQQGQQGELGQGQQGQQAGGV